MEISIAIRLFYFVKSSNIETFDCKIKWKYRTAQFLHDPCVLSIDFCVLLAKCSRAILYAIEMTLQCTLLDTNLT